MCFCTFEIALFSNFRALCNNIYYFLFDLGYLRDQMTITEVTMARLYNWDVKRRKEKKEAESAKS